MMQNKRVELLAPAGNKEAFYGAIHAGADAVYLGGSRFGARAYADNFSEAELISCIRYAHIFGRRVYLTVNTLVKESEFPELYDYLKPFYEAGLDGVIVQDIGVFSYIREQFPGMELHVSTQMTITGKYGAKLLKDMGACRIVPARELSLAEIVEMKKYANAVSLETFIHGAMCYCYSGQCLFSSVLGGRSGNRGRCAQPCRLPYTVKTQNHTSKECYPLSLKDMCTIEQLPALIEAGIDSFKIEGRMKKPEYAAGVTAIYRKYIDKYYANPGKAFQVSREDLEKLSRLYIRSERQNGYYYKHNGKDMITLDSPAYSGSDEALLGDIRTKYLERSLKLPVSIYGYFQVGEEASVTYIAGDLSVTVTGETVQQAAKQPVSAANIEKQLSRLGESVFRAEEINITLSEQAFYSLKALNELRREAVEKLEDLIIEEHGLPVFRELKSDFAGNMKEQDIEQKRNRRKIPHEYRQGAPIRSNSGLHLSVQTLEQLSALESFAQKDKLSRIYINGDILYQLAENMTVEDITSEEKNSDTNRACFDISSVFSKLDILQDTEIIISLPYILREKDDAYLEYLHSLALRNPDLFQGFRVSSLEALGFLRSKNYKGSIYTDAGFYMWNLQTLQEWSEAIAGFCLPYELKGGEQRGLLQNSHIPCEKIFYGRIPMMVTANCVAKTTDRCYKDAALQHKNSQLMVQLTDRYHKTFPAALNCIHCMNIIYNSLPLSLHSEWSKWKQLADMRLDFTVESGPEMLKILDFFVDVYMEIPEDKRNKVPFSEYTTGHEKRGVE